MASRAGLRQRGSRADATTTTLGAPLVENEMGPEAGARRPEAGGRRRENDPDWEDGLGKRLAQGEDEVEKDPRPCTPSMGVSVITSCARMLLDLVRSIGLLPPKPPPPTQLSLTARSRLDALWARVRVPFDATDAEHAASLRALYALAFPDLPPLQEADGVKTAQWKEMGWQGEDPATDFRGAGLISLEQLLYMGRQHPHTFIRLMLKKDGTRSEWEYPFAVGGLNVTYMLTELLELRKEPDVPRSAVFKGFAKLLEADESALEHVYVGTCELLDATWLQHKASYMEFPMVMAATKKAVEGVLTSGQCDTAQAVLERLRELALAASR